MSDGVRIRVTNPRHFSFSGTHVWGWNVDSRSKEALLCQFNGESTCNPFKLIFAVSFGIDFDSSLTTTKGDINTGTLVSHQSRESFDLIGADIERVTDTTLAGTPSMENIAI